MFDVQYSMSDVHSLTPVCPWPAFNSLYLIKSPFTLALIYSIFDYLFKKHILYPTQTETQI